MNSKLKNLLTLSLIPGSLDCGLLLLRVWLGLSMFLIHGLGKLQKFDAIVSMFHEKMGISAPFAVAAILSESLCSILLVLGLATRWAALFLATTMAVAFFKAHGATLIAGNPKSGEIAFLYLAGFVTILIAGAGRFSIDGKIMGICCSEKAQVPSDTSSKVSS